MRNNRISLLLPIAICFSCLNLNNPTPVDNQLTSEVEAIDAFLKTNTTDYIAYSPYGVRFVVHKFGNDAPPRKEQTVNFSYIGKVFKDSTLFAIATVNSPIEQVNVKGLTEWIPSLQGGSIATIFVPSKYAYGNIQNSKIPSNTPVFFQVTFTGITKSATQQAQFSSDTTSIRNFLNTNAIVNTVLHPSGISYKIDIQGNGIYPKPYDNVNVHYKGSTMADRKVFQESDLNSTSIFSLIDGLIVGIPLISEGGKATFYIPSGLGYGVDGSGDIAKNSNLIFEITLKSIAK